MENASKALIMAGSVLIAILVATFFVLVLRKGGQLSAEYDRQNADNELVKFNNQFEAFHKDDNTIFDVITAANLAYDVNKKCGWDEPVGVKVELIISGTEKYYILPTRKDSEKNYFYKTDRK